jgi:hypothetical protein
MPSNELTDFTAALARAGIACAHVPLEIYAHFCNHVGMSQVSRDETGPLLSLASGALIIRPIYKQQEIKFESAEDVNSFIENSRRKL